MNILLRYGSRQRLQREQDAEDADMMLSWLVATTGFVKGAVLGAGMAMAAGCCASRCRRLMR
jgi:hypothetical protein